MQTVKVHYAELLPHEFRERLRAKPIAYLPLGTLEWHGEHLPLGADALQSQGLMEACVRDFGGIVLPPLYLGPDRAMLTPGGAMLIGMDYAESTTPPRPLDGSCYWISAGFFKSLLDAVLEQLKRAGFQAVFADGHGPSRISWVADIPERQKRFGLKLFGVSEDIAAAWKTQIDHAAQNETSLVMALRPDLVDLTKLPQDPAVYPQGVGGVDPRLASAEFSEECLAVSLALVIKKFQEAGL